MVLNTNFLTKQNRSKGRLEKLSKKTIKRGNYETKHQKSAHQELKILVKCTCFIILTNTTNQLKPEYKHEELV